MAILFPNLTVELRRKTGQTLQGRPTWGDASTFKVAIVTLRDKAERSSVRADSSASRGRVEEPRADAVVLVPPKQTIGNGDRLRLLGANYEVSGVFPRLDLKGVLAHYQVDLRVLSGA